MLNPTLSMRKGWKDKKKKFVTAFRGKMENSVKTLPELKKLPIGIQSFERIIKKGHLYVDKTENIYQLISRGEVYFLSRPRRFGKSLLVSTLRNIFEGNKKIFKGLWIYKNSDWKWKKYPVIVFDFNGIPHDSTETLEEELIFKMEEHAERNGFQLKAKRLGTKLRELILKLKEKTRQNVVILVDEYDKPIIDFIGKGEDKIKIAIKNRELLKSFYGVLKEADVAPALKFVFITGISKFSKVSIFSELNNLNDLTMQKNYSDLLGYTQEELETYFKDRIRLLGEENKQNFEDTKEKLKFWYNGYRFSEREIKVYNPFSILKVFDEMTFKNYWFETGSPTFIISLIKEKNIFPPGIEHIEVTEDIFSQYEIENLKIEALLFQTGYLTIKDVKKHIYTLSYPNQEVQTSLLRHLFAVYSNIENSTDRSRFILLSAYLEEKKYDNFFEIIKSLYAGIPYTLSSKADESYFHSLFYLMVCASGVDSLNEVLTCTGRIDLVIEFTDKLFIIEFKCNQSSEAGIKQIKEKKYYERYVHQGKKIFLMGINFNTTKKNIDEWKVEELQAELQHGSKKNR